jgi:hypothetical protein
LEGSGKAVASPRSIAWISSRTVASSPAATIQGSGPAGEDPIEEIRFPDLLIARGVRRLTKRVLFPVRFLYTAATGRVGTNDAAVASYLADKTAPGTGLVAAALAWRTSQPSDEAATAALVREQIVPLYLYYIADHIARLDSLGEVELAEAFREWRHRLVR